MHNFKKTLIAIISWLLAVILISVILIVPYMRYEQSLCVDAGIDTVICGSSQAEQGLIPSVIDEELGTVSYNMSADAVTLYGRKAILESVHNHTDADIAIVEISIDSLTKTGESGEGDMYTLNRLCTSGDRLRFIAEYCSLNDLQESYAHYLFKGLSYWKDWVKGDLSDEHRGYYPLASDDVSISEDYADYYNMTELPTEMPAENQWYLTELLGYLSENYAEAYVIVTPLCDKIIWEGDDWDIVMSYLRQACAEYNIPCYDINLCKDRYEIFNDVDSYCNDTHLSEIGAQTMSERVGELIQMERDGRDTGEMFWSSYEEMKRLSPYMLCQ